MEPITIAMLFMTWCVCGVLLCVLVIGVTDRHRDDWWLNRALRTRAGEAVLIVLSGPLIWLMWLAEWLGG